MPWADALTNVALPLELAGVSKIQARERAAAALTAVGLGERLSARPRHLSGGMAMRAALARALVTAPDLLLLDEPFAALDSVTRRKLIEDLHALWSGSDPRPAVIFVTHDVEEAVYLAQRVVVLDAATGRAIADLPTPGAPPRALARRSRLSPDGRGDRRRAGGGHAPRDDDMRRLAELGPPLLLAILLLAVWEAACRLLDLPVYFLPPPSAVAVALVEAGPRLAASAWITFGMAVQALVLAGLVGGGLALAVSLHPAAERAVRPLAVALQVTPVVAVAPLVLIWAGLDHADRAVVALAAVVAFFPLFSGILTGLKSADPDLERLFDLYGATPLQRLWRLRLPSALPFALEGLRVAAGLAVIGAVVAEFVSGSGATQGLAWRLLEAGNRLRTAEMLAGVLCLTLLGLVLNAAVGVIGRFLLRR